MTICPTTGYQIPSNCNNPQVMEVVIEEDKKNDLFLWSIVGFRNAKIIRRKIYDNMMRIRDDAIKNKKSQLKKIQEGVSK